MVDKETGELKHAKVTKMQVMRIALCRKPAVPEAEFVLVKSADPDEQLCDHSSSSEGGDQTCRDTPNGDVTKSNEDVNVLVESTVELTVDQKIEKAVETAIQAVLSKMPTSANNGSPPWKFVEAEGAAEVQEAVKILVKTCNESTIVPRGVKELVGDIAKYHGVEGPDASDETMFSEFVAQMKALLPVMQQMVVAMAKTQPAAVPPAAGPPAGGSAPAKPAPAKKSVDEVDLEKETKPEEVEEDESVAAAGKKKTKSKEAIDSDDGGEPIEKGCSAPASTKVMKSEVSPEVLALLLEKKHKVDVLMKIAEQVTRTTKKAFGHDPDHQEANEAA